jgi:hypothetical protein
VGLLYLLLLAAALRLIYTPAKLFVPGDAVATANNIASHEMLFRLGILAELFNPVAGDLYGTRFLRTIQASELETGGANRPAWRRDAVGDLLCECGTDAVALTLARGGGGLLSLIQFGGIKLATN